MLPMSALYLNSALFERSPPGTRTKTCLHGTALAGRAEGGLLTHLISGAPAAPRYSAKQSRALCKAVRPDTDPAQSAAEHEETSESSSPAGKGRHASHEGAKTSDKADHLGRQACRLTGFSAVMAVGHVPRAVYAVTCRYPALAGCQPPPGQVTPKAMVAGCTTQRAHAVSRRAASGSRTLARLTQASTAASNLYVAITSDSRARCCTCSNAATPV